MILYGRDIKIFACNSNMAVAHEIADHLGTSLGKSEVGTFSDGEIAVSIGESVRESDVFIIQYIDRLCRIPRANGGVTEGVLSR